MDLQILLSLVSCYVDCPGKKIKQKKKTYTTPKCDAAKCPLWCRAESKICFAKTLMCCSVSSTIQNPVPSVFISTQDTITHKQKHNTQTRDYEWQSPRVFKKGTCKKGAQRKWVTLILQHFDWALNVHDDDNDDARGFSSLQREKCWKKWYPSAILVLSFKDTQDSGNRQPQFAKPHVGNSLKSIKKKLACDS